MNIVAVATVAQTARFEADRLKSQRLLEAGWMLESVADDFAAGRATATELKAASYDLMDAIPEESDLTTTEVIAAVRMALVAR